MNLTDSNPSIAISSLISFFELTNYIFEIEKNQITLTNNNSSDLEAELKPNPPNDISSQDHKTSTNDFDIGTFDPFAVPQEFPPPFYLPIKYSAISSKAVTTWYFYFQNNHQILVSDSLINIETEPKKDINKKTLTFTYDNKSHSYKVKKFKIFFEEQAQSSKSFKLLSFCYEQFPIPPISPQTFSFYSYIVRNPYYLYILTKMDYKYQEDIPFYHSFAKATGPHFILIFSILVFETFQPLHSPSLILRSNNFLSATLTSLLRLDEGFISFCNRMSQIENNEPVDYFLNQFEQLELNIFSRVILNILFYLATNKFPNNKEVGFDAVSGVLFLRLMSRIMIHNGVDIKILNTIRKFYNFGVESENIDRLKKLILQHIKLPKSIHFSDLTYLNQELTADDILKVRDRSYLSNDSFIKAINSEDFSLAIQEYRSHYKDIFEMNRMNESCGAII